MLVDSITVIPDFNVSIFNNSNSVLLLNTIVAKAEIYIRLLYIVEYITLDNTILNFLIGRLNMKYLSFE